MSSTPSWKQKLEQNQTSVRDLSTAELLSALNDVTSEDSTYSDYRRKALIKQEAISRGEVEKGELVDLSR